jgi:hypothetical protein
MVRTSQRGVPMTSDGSSIERLREYLQSLSPEARAMLIAELERALLRQEDVAGSELVLQELRNTVRAAGQPVPRIGDAARKFFLPLETFLFEGPAEHKRIGRLARVSLEPIWEWIGRDLMPAEVAALSEDINRALLADDRVKVEQLVRALHDRAIQRMSAAIAALGSNEKAHRRFSVQVGTPRPVEDVTTLMHILSGRDVLAELARRLPDHFRAFERENADHVKALFDSVLAQKSPEHAAPPKSDLFLYALILLASRLAAPWQLIRIATRAADSDEVARIAATPYAVAVTIVLSELESKVGDLRAALKACHPVASLLKSIHDAARGMRTEMDLSIDSVWSRQLTAIRGAVSSLLTAEMEMTPGRVRRLLRPRPAEEIVSGSLLDAFDVHEVETRVELVGVCRHYASELAVSEVTLRTYSELAQYLETGTRILLDALRHADDDERPFRHSQVDAAVRFCRTVFGADYAGLLAKAADVALQGAAADRRAARV